MRKSLALALLLGGYSYGQSCPGYAHTYDITIPASAVRSTLANFTVMIHGTYPYLAGAASGGFTASGNGYDIAFAQDQSLLTWSMPKYVGETGEIRAFVLLPSVSSSSPTVFQLCVGKPGVAAFQGGANPYDSNTAMALLFKSDALPFDDTEKQTATNHGVTYSGNAPAHLGGAGVFDGASAWIDLGDTPGFTTGNGPRTITWWGRPSSTNTQPVVLSYGTSDGSHSCFYMTGVPPGKSMFHDCTYAGAAPARTTWPLNEWRRYDGVWNPGNGTFSYYFDGAPDGTSTFGGSIATTLSASSLGALFHASNWFAGSMSKVKFATTARSADWIAAEYLNETNPDPGFYRISVPPVPPAIMSGPTCSPNSPSSVYCSWTTDVKSDSQIRCGTAPGGPYPYSFDRHQSGR